MAVIVVAAGTLTVGAPAGGYGAARLACALTDPRVDESSGVASASWGDDVVWTHNDSGDQPRFFAIDTATCAVRSVYDVAGAKALDWEDMARSGTTLHFGDIGDNDAKRASVTVYDVAEPGRDAPSGAVRPAASRVLTYPDGPHDAESLFVDPATGRLAVVTKDAPGEAGVYLAPLQGSGGMERVAAIPVGSATGADATADRIVVRDYVSASEWTMRAGDTLAGAFGGVPGPIVLPLTLQGEAVAYARDGAGIWTTAEQHAGEGPIHFVPAEPLSQALEPPAATAPGRTADDGDSAVPLAAAIGAPVVIAALLIGLMARRRHRHAMPRAER